MPKTIVRAAIIAATVLPLLLLMHGCGEHEVARSELFDCKAPPERGMPTIDRAGEVNLRLVYQAGDGQGKRLAERIAVALGRMGGVDFTGHVQPIAGWDAVLCSRDGCPGSTLVVGKLADHHPDGPPLKNAVRLTVASVGGHRIYTLQGHGPFYRELAAHRLLHWVGVRFIDPWRTVYPSHRLLVFPVQGVTEAYTVKNRVMHFETAVPNEAARAFLVKDEEAVSRAHAIVDWAAALGMNEIRWTIPAESNVKALAPHWASIREYALERGVRLSGAVSLHGDGMGRLSLTSSQGEALLSYGPRKLVVTDEAMPWAHPPDEAGLWRALREAADDAGVVLLREAAANVSSPGAGGLPEIVRYAFRSGALPVTEGVSAIVTGLGEWKDGDLGIPAFGPAYWPWWKALVTAGRSKGVTDITFKISGFEWAGWAHAQIVSEFLLRPERSVKETLGEVFQPLAPNVCDRLTESLSRLSGVHFSLLRSAGGPFFWPESLDRRIAVGATDNAYSMRPLLSDTHALRTSWEALARAREKWERVERDLLPVLPRLGKEQRQAVEEIIDGLTLSRLRIGHAEALLSAVLSVNFEDELSRAIGYRQLANVLVAAELDRAPAYAEAFAGPISFPSEYDYGYLRPAFTLAGWIEEEERVRRMIRWGSVGANPR